MTGPKDVFYVLSAFEAPLRGVSPGRVSPEAVSAAARMAAACGSPQIFWRNVKAFGLEGSVPAPLAESFAKAERAAFANGLYWRAVFRAFLAATAAAGVRCVPLKGLSLAERVYGEEALRMTSDLDILIDRADFEACRRALESGGFRMRDKALRGVLPNHGQECVWTDAQGSEIDLHYRLFPWYEEAYLYKIDSGDFLKRAQPGRWDGYPVRFLEPTDEAHYLLLSAAVDGGFRYFADVDALVYRLRSAIDWDRLGAALRRGPASVRLRGTALFLERRFGTPFPAGFTRGAAAERGPERPAASKAARQLAALSCASPADALRLAAVFARWRLFKSAGLFRAYFIRANNPVPQAFP